MKVMTSKAPLQQFVQSAAVPLSSGFLVALLVAGDSRAFSSTVAVFSDTRTCLAIYLVRKPVGDFSTSKLTGSPKMYNSMIRVFNHI